MLSIRCIHFHINFFFYQIRGLFCAAGAVAFTRYFMLLLLEIRLGQEPRETTCLRDCRDIVQLICKPPTIEIKSANIKHLFIQQWGKRRSVRYYLTSPPKISNTKKQKTTTKNYLHMLQFKSLLRKKCALTPIDTAISTSNAAKGLSSKKCRVYLHAP